MNLVESIEKSLKKNDKIPAMRSGDTVRVHQKIVEGDKERIQVFQGTVIRPHTFVHGQITPHRVRHWRHSLSRPAVPAAHPR